MPSQQEKLSLNTDPTNIESYKFEPIKGYPMLHWRGKRPFESTQYYPAQLKESHGEPSADGWMNQIFWGDNLQVMSHLLKKYRGQVKLIYIDPPFDSKADYKKKIAVRGQAVANDQTVFEEKQYSDIWTNDEYLQFMYERLVLLRELLADDGAIYLHCDYRKSHQLRSIMDEIFGQDQFQNEIVWLRTNAHNMKSKGYVRSNDHIIFYTKSHDFVFNELFTNYSDAQLSRYKTDENGRLYTGQDLTFSSTNASRQFEWRGTKPPSNRSWGASLEQLEKWWNEGKILTKKDGTPRMDGLKVYLDETKGSPLTTNWSDIGRVGNTSSERTEYPTQKPEDLLERIIKVSSNENDLIFDCFMGSGTTQAVAMKLGRRFLGADINLGAIQTTTKRLLSVAADLNKQLDHDKYHTGFEVYNVNHYDVFRNPVQARDLLLEALEIQPLPGNIVWDGEKDGRFVKILPVNRIATRADLNELIANLDYRAYEKRHHESPNKAVESITLVCMGHEPDLAAVLKEQVPFRLDVEVVDILRDKSKLEFRRDSEADIRIEKGNLVIKAFYPMNLLQKLSLMKENVKDWRELTESVMIDFNYDEGVFAPQITDIPDKNDMVRGTYPVPPNAGTIRVKITDLLSESLEISIKT